MSSLHALILPAVLAACLVSTARAERVYINPSDQKGNWDPDHTYCEADNMQDVARRLEAKLLARGFEVKNSNGGTMSEATTAANEWPADIYVSIHSNAAGRSSNKELAHGTNTLFFQPRDGSPPNPLSVDLSIRCHARVIEKMTTYGRNNDFGVTGDLPFLTYNLYVLRRTTMPGTLVEGLFHDNEEDVAVLKTEEGRDAYAQGVYEGICDHFGMSYYPDAPILDPVGQVANDSDGLLAFVSLTDKGNIQVCRQAGVNCVWAGEWLDLKGSSAGDPVIGRNAQGRLQVFIRDTNGRIRHKVQSSVGSSRWNGWYDLGGNAASDPVLGKTADGRLAVYVVGADGHWQMREQKSVTSGVQWENWHEVDAMPKPVYDLGEDGVKDLGGSFVGRPAVSVSTDGRFEVFAIDGQGAMSHNSQGSGGKWSGWQSLGGSFVGDPAVGRNRDGRIEVFALRKDGQVMYKVQREPSKSAIWDGWYPLGVAPPPVYIR